MSGDSGGIIDNDGGDPKQLQWWINRFTEITQTLGRDLEEFPENPSQAISQIMNDIPLLVADEVGHAVEAYQAFAPQIQALVLALPLVSVGFLGGFAGLGGLTGLSGIAAVPTPTDTPIQETPSVATNSGSPVPSGASAPASTPASAPTSAPATASTVTTTAGAAPPPPGAGPAVPPYPYLVGGTGISASTGLSTSARRKAPEPDIAAVAAAAAASAREKERARRRRRSAMRDHHRGHRYEFLGLDSDSPNIDAAPDVSAGQDLAAAAVASDQGGGTLGFAGTARGAADIVAAGLTTLAGDGFGGGPSVPMVPGTWEQRGADSGGGDVGHDASR